MKYLKRPTTMNQHTSGFSLIEMVISLSVISIVFLAMGSVMVVATKAVPDLDPPTTLRIESSDVLEQIVSELQVAVTVTTATDKRVTFTVPDRDNNSVDETITYQWSGTVGDPLLRQYNGGNLVEVMAGVTDFNLDYDTEVISTPGVPITSREVLLAHHNEVQIAHSMDYVIEDKKWIGQVLSPTNLPADALSWSLTRVFFKGKPKGSADGRSRVQIRPVNGSDKPTDTVYDYLNLYESILTSDYDRWWRCTYDDNDVKNLSPSTKLAFVVKWWDNSDAAQIQYDNQEGTGLLRTANEGDYWTLRTNMSMVYRLYGTYTTPGPVVTTYKLRNVTVSLAADADPDAEGRASIITLSRPEMP